MASWYTNIITTTSTRLNKVFASEADGDTEDDTHVCRVLRAYYTENNKALPGWLPPDPKAPPPPPPQAVRQNGVGSRYGNNQPGSGSSQGSGLSSLWDDNPQQNAGGPPSLRQGRGPARGDMAAPPNSRNPFARGAPAADPRDAVQARPLPSQRAGSYQTAYDSNGSAPPGSSGGSGGSAQDRLKQRLWGGARTASPASSGPFQPPAAAPAQQSSSRSRGGGGNYEDSFAPGGSYDSGRGGGGRSGGLPSGPRRMGGLPSGPRMR